MVLLRQAGLTDGAECNCDRIIRYVDHIIM